MNANTTYSDVREDNNVTIKKAADITRLTSLKKMIRFYLENLFINSRKFSYENIY